ncbi:hypothetical protein WJX72_003342 [[Myrmecia] bisecta]|uniref:protein-tyrosine-phosphatase n=1 Tax=[Myrmecia] bisecta TaxID=41462 RepID=A0AAW1QPW2_9CHLO
MLEVDEFSQGLEIIPGRFYFLSIQRPESVRRSPIAASSILNCIDSELVYEPFFADFGPLNLGQTYRFCQRTNAMLQDAERQNKRVYYYTGPHAQNRANAATLVGIYQVLLLNRTVDQAYQAVSALQPFLPYRDASSGPSSFHLTVYDCIAGIAKAKSCGFIDWDKPNSTFNVEEYEHYEQVENGDLNWILPGKLLAFSGPAAIARVFYGYKQFTPEDYWSYFKSKGIRAVVRLNKQMYEGKRFTDGGFQMHELYFPDGSCPSEAILQKFLEVAESEPGALAIHCKAGLGRTGVLICSYLIKHYQFTPEEAIGYIRVCRPGSVIGPQQNYLKDNAAKLLREGQLFRQRMGQAAAKAKPERPSTAIGIRANAGSEQAAGMLVAGTSQRTLSRSQSTAGAAASSSRTRVTEYLRSKAPSFRSLSARSTSLGPGKSAAEVSSPAGPRRGPSFRRADTSPPQSLAQLAASTSFKSRGGPSAGMPVAAIPLVAGTGSVTRALAPNGQPRKVPTALLAAGGAAMMSYVAGEESPTGGQADHGWTIAASSVAANTRSKASVTTYANAYSSNGPQMVRSTSGIRR